MGLIIDAIIVLIIILSSFLGYKKGLTKSFLKRKFHNEYSSGSLFFLENMPAHIRNYWMIFCVSFHIFAEKRKNGKSKTKENNP